MLKYILCSDIGVFIFLSHSDGSFHDGTKDCKSEIVIVCS